MTHNELMKAKEILQEFQSKSLRSTRSLEREVDETLLALKELVTNKINEAEEWGDLIDRNDIREAVAKLFWDKNDESTDIEKGKE